jgi:hypothetical protein
MTGLSDIPSQVSRHLVEQPLDVGHSHCFHILSRVLPTVSCYHSTSCNTYSWKRLVQLKKSCYSDRLCGLVVRVPGYRTEMYCFLWGTDWIYICYVEESRPPLWSSGQSSWQQNGDVLCFLWGTNLIYVLLARTSSNSKLQTRSLVREGATK